jgi:uncharacterized lipoprotein YajG
MVTKFILDPIMRILKIVVTGTVLLLAACAEPQSQSVLSMTKVLASESTNLSIVECSLGIKMLDDKETHIRIQAAFVLMK